MCDPKTAIPIINQLLQFKRKTQPNKEMEKSLEQTINKRRDPVKRGVDPHLSSERRKWKQQ